MAASKARVGFSLTNDKKRGFEMGMLVLQKSVVLGQRYLTLFKVLYNRSAVALW